MRQSYLFEKLLKFFYESNFCFGLYVFYKKKLEQKKHLVVHGGCLVLLIGCHLHPFELALIFTAKQFTFP